MAVRATVTGVKETLDNLDAAERGIVSAFSRGLLKSGLLVEREALPMTPKDTGNLRASSYTKLVGPLLVRVGYTAPYALYVHENVQMKLKGQPRHSGSKKGSYWDNGEPKFLEKAEKQTRRERRRVIAKEVQNELPR